ncbi:MAG: hypothetical protein ACE5LX_10325 [Nitrospinota bacterium]
MTRRSFAVVSGFLFLAGIAITGVVVATRIMTPIDLVKEAKASTWRTIDINKALELIEEQ